MQDVVFGTINRFELRGTKRAIVIECAIELYFGEAQGRRWYHGHSWLSMEELEERVDRSPDELAAECFELQRLGILECRVALGSGLIQSMGISDGLQQHIQDQARRSEKEHEARHHVQVARDSLAKPPSDGLKRQARELFEYTCELCRCVGRQGRDARGKDFVASKVKKDHAADPENVTLLCSACSMEHRKRDLPLECRTVAMMRIAYEKGERAAERTAKPAPPKTKEIRIKAIGLSKVDIVDAGVDVPENP